VASICASLCPTRCGLRVSLLIPPTGLHCMNTNPRPLLCTVALPPLRCASEPARSAIFSLLIALSCRLWRALAASAQADQPPHIPHPNTTPCRFALNTDINPPPSCSYTFPHSMFTLTVSTCTQYLSAHSVHSVSPASCLLVRSLAATCAP